MTRRWLSAVRAVRSSVGRGASANLVRRGAAHLSTIDVLPPVLAVTLIVGGLALISQNAIATRAAAALGSTLLAAALGYRRGRWLVERTALSWHFHRRRRPETLSPTVDDEWPLELGYLAPDLTAIEVGLADGSRVGVGVDDAGWFAVAAVDAAALGNGGLVEPAFCELPLDLLTSEVTQAGQPGVVLHVVTTRAPADAVGRTWLTVRMDIRALAEAGVENVAGAPAATASLLRRLARSLRQRPIAVDVCDRRGLVNALAASCGLARPAHPAARPREEWRYWLAGGLAHQTFWVRDWPADRRARDVLDAVATTAPAVLTSVALIVIPDGDDVVLRCLVRIAAQPTQLGASASALTDRARLASAHLVRLDGEHRTGAYATAPTGGGAW
jgi:ESX secretion system protein EccE